ncbi:MAG TPA: hypothetical protein VGI17_16095 [Solirubrobacterales bacterium]
MYHRPPKSHPVAITVALVLAALVGVIAIASIWANRELLDTDSWVSVSGRLLESHDVRHRVATFLGEELVDETEKHLDDAGQGQVADRVVPPLRRRQVELAEEVMATPQFKAIWRRANRVGHRDLLRVLDEEEPAGEDSVVVDLTPALRQLAELVGRDGLERELGISDLGRLVAPGAARIDVLEAEELEVAQDAVRVVRHLTVPAVIAVIALYLLALLLGRRRLSRAFLGVGIALAATGALALLARALAGHEVVDQVARQGDREAARAAWSIATSTIVHLSIGAIVLGALVLIAALLVGRRRRRLVS